VLVLAASRWLRPGVALFANLCKHHNKQRAPVSRADSSLSPCAAAAALARRASLGSGEVSLEALEGREAGGHASIAEAYAAILLGFLVQVRLSRILLARSRWASFARIEGGLLAIEGCVCAGSGLCSSGVRLHAADKGLFATQIPPLCADARDATALMGVLCQPSHAFLPLPSPASAGLPRGVAAGGCAAGRQLGIGGGCCGELPALLCGRG
jgi:hypothetical protein